MDETYQFYWAGCLVVIGFISVIVFLLLFWSARQRKKYYKENPEMLKKVKEEVVESEKKPPYKMIGRDEIVRKILLPASVGFLLLGILTFFYQIYIYLYDGAWYPISLRDALILILPDAFQAWLLHPNSWIGINNIISVTPLSLFSIGLSFVIFWYCIVSG